MTKIIAENVYASKYITGTTTNCLCHLCKKRWYRWYELKYVDTDINVVNDDEEIITICRNCMIESSIDTKIKIKCKQCNSYYKNICGVCKKQEKTRNTVINKITILLKTIEKKEHLIEICNLFTEQLEEATEQLLEEATK